MNFAALIVSLLLGMPGIVSAGSDFWTPLGPASGTVTSFAIDPQNPATVYAAACAGLFKTSDEGTTWNAVAPGPPACISTLVMDPNTPRTLYAVTSIDRSVLKSTDAGANWTSENSGLPDDNAGGHAVTALVINPQSPGTLYASSAIIGGVFKTIDGGKTWNATNSGLPDGRVMALAINPQNPSILFASTEKNGIFQSTDSAASWSAVNSGIDDEIARGYNYISVFAIDSQDPNTVYAARRYDCGDCDVPALYKSIDGGMNWIGAATGLKAGVVLSLATDPLANGGIYAGSPGGIFASIDGGGTWNAVKSRQTGDSYGTMAIPALAIDPQTPGTVYAASTSAGILKTTDAGVTWTIANRDLKANTPTSIRSLKIDRQNPGTMYAVTNDGIFKTADAGATWSGVNAGLPLGAVFDIAGNPATTFSALEIAPRDSSAVYTADACCQDIYRSMDGGASWNTTLARDSAGIVVKGARLTALSLAVDPENSRTLYAAGFYIQAGTGGASPGKGIFKSTDAGAHWISASTGLPGDPQNQGFLITTLTVDPRNPNTVYAGSLMQGLNSAGTGLFKSTNGGQSWKRAGLDGFGSRVDILAIDPQDSNIIYAAVYKRPYVWPVDPNGFGFLFKSTNGGATWTGINSGL
jgi:photosystem II stability/assembly factor-like uncharacterized protein